MPQFCSVCSKKWYNGQNCIECNTCKSWIHHGNRLECSGLTDQEFAEHQIDEFKPFECDHCVSERIAKDKNTIFFTLPYPVECEDNPFGKPELKTIPDISSMMTFYFIN